MTSRQVKHFVFKKVDWYGKGRKINQPEITMSITYNDDNKPCLSICGEVWNSKHSDIICGGQCLDEMAKYESLMNDPTFNKLYYLHQNYHLNDCHAGTVAQEAALKAYHEACDVCNMNKSHDYTSDCEYLKSIELFEDNGWKYGHGWKYHEIPEDDMNAINELLAS